MKQGKGFFVKNSSLVSKHGDVLGLTSEQRRRSRLVLYGHLTGACWMTRHVTDPSETEDVHCN